MKVGSLVYPTESGLGRLAKSFFDAGIVTHPMIVRHAHFDNHCEWYPPDTPQTPIRPVNSRAVELHARKCDVMLFFETPFHWGVIPYCRKYGIKTVLMPMYECTPRHMPYVPDFFLCPSVLDQQYFEDHPSTFLPVPVDGVEWRQRERAEVFVHNAGHGGMKGRNGTGVLLDAMKHVKSPIKLILRSQKPLQWSVDDPRIDVRIGTVPHSELWAEGDVFIHPHRWDGLSLPLQEARAAGMLVMGVDRMPDNTWLDRNTLIPVSGYERMQVGGGFMEFDAAVIDPKEMAQHIDFWHGTAIRSYSQDGRQWAAENSWDVLRPEYLRVLEGLL